MLILILLIASNIPAYPFADGPYIYGNPISANMGPGGGKFRK